MKSGIARRFWLLLLLGTASAVAQSIQPIITEYKGSADGKFAVTNNSLIPMVVVLEPRSFDVDEQGKGIYRELDRNIHVDLSSMSFMLQPQQSHYVFYHASAERLPAWFTVYATFSAVSHGEGVDVRLMLPHTVYLYGQRAVEKEQIQIRDVVYNETANKVSGTIVNDSASLIRVQAVKATGRRAAADLGGFPLLPGKKRVVELEWSEAAPPTKLEFQFAGFTLERPTAIKE